MPRRLTKTQKEAIAFCNKKAKIYSKGVLPNLHAKLVDKGLSKEDILKVFKYFKNVPLIIHFNPTKTLHFLEKDGIVKNLFQVNASGGCTNKLSRLSWETKLFNGIYDNSPAHEKVKYGTLNLTSNPIGVSVCTGYGNSYLLLKSDVKKRVSFVFDDSSRQDYHIATFKHFFNIIYYSNDKLLNEMIDIALNKKSYSDYSYSPYVEAQIHGKVSLADDVDKICINSTYRHNDNILNTLKSIKKKYDVEYNFV